MFFNVATKHRNRQSQVIGQFECECLGYYLLHINIAIQLACVWQHSDCKNIRTFEYTN